MKEEDLNKAIGLKKTLDDKRELLQIANSHYVDLRVNLEENYLLDNDVIKGLRAMVIANIERRINDLQEELEKL